MSDKGHIEEIFKKAVEGQKVAPSTKVLKNIRFRLFVADFFSLNPRKVNVAYTLIVLTGLYYLQFNSGKDSLVQTDHIPKKTKANTEVLTNEVPDVIVENVVEVEEVEEAAEKQNESYSAAAVAAYRLSNSSGCAPLTVNFENNSANVNEYLWNFGTGVTSKEKNPIFVYYRPGTYTVTLEVKGANGTKAVQQQKIIVYSKPVSDFEIDVTASDVNEKKVLFKNKSKNAVTYKWDFGDKSFSKEVSPEHTYTEYKTYNVSMIALSKHGCADTTSYFNSFVAENYSLVFPKRFKPNLNSQNNGFYQRPENKPFVFYPQNHGASDYSLVIKTISGSQVFKTTNLKQGWNGYISGRVAPAGQYQYTASGTYPNGQDFEFNGTFTIVIDDSYQDFYNY